MTSPGRPLSSLTPRERCDQQVKQMEAARQPMLQSWRDTEAYVAPFAANVDQIPYRFGDGFAVVHEAVYFCRATLAAFLSWGMTNQSRQWRQWAIKDPQLQESQAVKEFMHELNARSMTMLARSNFYEVQSLVYGEWPAFGTSVVLIEEDERDLVRYVLLGIGSYTLADDARGETVAIAREVSMTVRQVVARFATDASGDVNLSVLSKSTKDAVARGALEDMITVCHLITPNDDYAPSKQTPEHFEWASLYWEKNSRATEGDGGFLAKEGYREWPAMVYRWRRRQGSPWGTDSPGILTAAANKSLQQVESDLLMMVEKIAKPPLVVPAELTSASLLPGAQNSVTTRAGMLVQPLHEIHFNAVTVVREMVLSLVDRVERLWHTRLILALSGGYDVAGDKTATEVEAIGQERYLVLGPLLDSSMPAFRAGSEREFAIMARAGVLPPIPPELEGVNLDIEYTSALAVAQKSIGLSDLERFALFAAELAKATGDPSVLRKLDIEQIMDEISIRAGVPPRVIRTDEQTKAIREAEAEAMAQQQAVEQGALEAKAARDLSQAPTGGDTALSALMGAGQQGGGLGALR